MSTRMRIVGGMLVLALVSTVLFGVLHSPRALAPSTDLRPELPAPTLQPQAPSALQAFEGERQSLPQPLAPAPTALVAAVPPEKPVGFIHVTVLLDGQPVADATVDVRGLHADGTLATFATTQSAPDGTFGSRLPATPVVEVIARWAELPAARVVVAADAPQASPILLNLHAPWSVSGVVM